MSENNIDACLISTNVNLLYTLGQIINGYVYLRQEGDALVFIVDILHNSGAVNSKWKFQLLGTAKEFDKKARAGEYELNAGMTPLEVMAKIQSGDVYLHRITVPEGYTVKQIAAKFAEAGFGSVERYMELSRDAELLDKYNIPAQTMEGYLYPDTYLLPKYTTEKAIVELMLRHMQNRITPEMRQRAAEIKMSLHQVLTLASIVEKETGVAGERPIIASVFHNRLKKNMRLESDPTAVYGVDLMGGGVTASHVRTDSPYNTYKISGLPPTPIASPGLDSINAVLYPANTKYLYFVATGNGGHKFSVTYDQHIRAVQEWRNFRNNQQRK